MKVLSLPRAFGVCIAICLLAGCNSMAGIASTQTVESAQDASQVGRPGNLGLIVPQRIRRETINGTSSGGAPSCPPSGRMGVELSVSVSGNATGPYPGTFTGGARALVACNSFGKTNMSGGFTITSGQSTTSGNFSGNGRFGCDYRGGGCGVTAGRDVTYSATVTRGGKVRKQILGHVSGNFNASHRGGSHESMDITLKNM
jgi:hypothetical protein